MSFKKILSFCFIFLGLLSALPALAVSDRDLIVTFTPKYPKPNQDINIKIISYSFNVPTASFVWKEDGKVKVQGIGKNEFSTQTKGLGEKTIVDLLILTNENTRYEKRMTITPTNLDLIVEAKTYTPYWYKGAPKMTSENEARAIAIPEIVGVDGKKINPATLVYNWTINGTKNLTQSGYGKDNVVFKPNSNTTIEVTASPLDGHITAYNKTIIQPEKTDSQIYEINPISGIDFFNAIKNIYTPKNSDIDLLIEPFYFNKQDLINEKLSTTISLTQADKKIDQTTVGRGIKLLVDPSLDKDEIGVDVQLTNTAKSFEKSRINFIMNLIKRSFNF